MKAQVYQKRCKRLSDWYLNEHRKQRLVREFDVKGIDSKMANETRLATQSGVE